MKIAPQNLVIVSLGSNLGDSPGILLDAMDRLAAFAEGPALRSSLWETQPVDCPPGSPAFLNAAAGFIPKTGLTPESLLAHLSKLEAAAGRKQKKIRNEPRPLDLDIITFQTEIRNSETLMVPHPRAHLRAFVLAPVAEVAPTLVFPGQTLSAGQLFGNLPEAEKRAVRILAAAKDPALDFRSAKVLEKNGRLL